MIITNQPQCNPSIRSMRVLKTTQLNNPFRSIIDLNRLQQPTLFSSFENDNKSLLYIHYKEYSYKYLILLMYFLSSMANSLSQMTTIQMANQLDQYYQLSPVTSILSNMAIQLPSMIVSIYLLDKHGIQKSMLIANLMNIAGSCLKLLLNSNLCFLFIGNLMTIVSQCLIVSIITLLSFQWFKPINRIISTIIMTMSNTIGLVIACVLIIVMLDQSPNKHKSTIFNLLYYTNYLIVAANVLSILLIKDKPSTPPCSQLNVLKVQFIQANKMIVSNINFILLTVYSALTIGTFNTLIVILVQLVHSLQFDINDTNLLIICLLSAGIFGSTFFAFIFTIFQNYKIMLAIHSLSFMVGLSINYVFYDQQTVLISSMSFIAFNMFPCISIIIELAAEITAPVSEIFSCGYIMLFCSFSTAVQTLLFIQYIDHSSRQSTCNTFMFMLGFNIVAMIMLIFVNQHLRRTQNDIIQEIHQSTIQ